MHGKEPGGACFETAYARVSKAAGDIGKVVPALDNKSTFGRLWGSYVAPQKTWLELPDEFRAKGAAGAMASAGLGVIVNSDGIWSGQLKPGAVLQVWRADDDFDRVKQGIAVVDGSYGHSFIFMHYKYVEQLIVGIVIADQGFQNSSPLSRSDYSYWVGANLP